VVRLLELGMDPFNFADSLAGVLAQRLARRLCEACRTSRQVTAREAAELAIEYCGHGPLEPGAVEAQWRQTYGGVLHLYHSPGCGQCKATGYRGRIGLHELMTVGPEHRTLINRRSPASELRAAASRLGMRTLKQDGIEKCLAGLTDLHEVRSASN
jgi:type II secretory ATPase GspE/PulE/Tfp pilus assembly ATPase PilB-like protein